MTIAPVAAPHEQVDEPVVGRGTSVQDALEVAALLLMLLVWARVTTVGAGGRDTGHLLAGILAAVPSVLLSGGRVLRERPMLWVALAPAAGTLLTCLLAPAQGTGAFRLATLTYAGLGFVAVLGFLRRRGRAVFVVLALLLVVLDQFTQAWLPWWGSEDPRHQMVGTFYWHNQFAAFMLPAVALGAALALMGPKRWRWVGFVVTPLAVSGVLYSTSRASLMLCGAALAATSLTALLRERQASRRVLLLAALVVGVAFFLVTPVFFPHGGWPWDALAARQADQSLQGNSSARWAFWVAGWHVFLSHPLAGPGFLTFGPQSQGFLAPGAGLSISAHNEVVETFAQGGLVAGLPLLVALAGLLRRVGQVRNWRRVGETESWALVGATVAVVAAVGHALVDFDWSYPALPFELAVVAALCFSVTAPPVLAPLPGDRSDSASPVRERPSLLPVTLALALVCGLGAGAAALRDQAERALRLSGAAVDQSLAQTASAHSSLLPDERVSEHVLELALGSKDLQSNAAARHEVEQALDRTSRLGSVDYAVQMTRAAALVRLARANDGVALARESALRDPLRFPDLVQSYAVVLGGAGHPQQAGELLSRYLLVLAAQHQPDTAAVRAVSQALVRLPAPADARLRDCALSVMVLRADVTATPAVGDTCRAYANVGGLR